MAENGGRLVSLYITCDNIFVSSENSEIMEFYTPSKSLILIKVVISGMVEEHRLPRKNHKLSCFLAPGSVLSQAQA